MIRSDQLTIVADNRYVGEASDFDETRRGFPDEITVVSRNNVPHVAKRDLITRREGEIESVEYKINRRNDTITVVLFND
jgi:hypothetical protein